MIQIKCLPTRNIKIETSENYSFMPMSQDTKIEGKVMKRDHKYKIIGKFKMTNSSY